MTTKQILITVFTLLLSLVTAKASPLTESADSAYAADNYQEALSLYDRALKADGPSAALWYNIGNTQYRLGNLGEAIVAYERSLRLDPSDPDTRANLDFVASRTVDRPGDTGSFISNTADTIASATTPNVWAWTAFGLFACALGALAVYFFSGGVLIRKTGFFGAIVLFVAALAACGTALRAARNASAGNRAVVTATSTILSTSPREPKDRSEEAMLLHEGTRVTIIDSVAVPGDTTGIKWYDVSVDNHHRAWIKSTEIEKI